MNTIPRLFDDRDWQSCLLAYLEDLSQKASHGFITEQRNILTGFFRQYRKHPLDCTSEDIEAFCTGEPSAHGSPSGETSSRRKRAIRRFYTFASTYQTGHQGALFQKANPALPETSLNKQSIPVLFADETWQSCLVAFIEQLRTDDTRANYLKVLARFFKDPSRCPDTYTRQECERFIRSAQSSKQHNHGEPVIPSPATINARKSCLSSFYEYSSGFQIAEPGKRLRGLMQTQSPTKGIRQERVEPTHRLLSESDMVALFSSISSVTAKGIRDRAMFMSYLFLGRRNRELRLLWQDIEPYTYTTREGLSYGSYRYRFKAKGKHGWQFAEMPKEVFDEICWYLIATDRLEIIQPTDGIFVQHRMTHDGRLASFSKVPLSSSSICHILKAYCKAANVDPCVCVHSFRHANAQWRYRCGQGIMEICKALGHSNVAVTHRYIFEVVEENDTGAPALAARLGPLLNV